MANTQVISVKESLYDVEQKKKEAAEKKNKKFKKKIKIYFSKKYNLNIFQNYIFNKLFIIT